MPVPGKTKCREKLNTVDLLIKEPVLSLSLQYEFPDCITLNRYLMYQGRLTERQGSVQLTSSLKNFVLKKVNKCFDYKK
jgi:hypothetical protein